MATLQRNEPMTEPTTTLTLAQALQHGIACHQDGRLQEAEHVYRAILANAPQHPDANHNLGVLLKGAARLADALVYFKAALEANPQVEQFWVSFAEALLRAGRTDHALQLIALARQHGHGGAAIAQVTALLEAAVSKAPAAHDPLVPAVASREAGHYQQAAQWLEAWLQIHPQDVAALALLAHVRLLNKQDEQAVKVLQQAQAIAPDHPDVLRNTVRLLLKRHQPDPAFQVAQQLLNKDSDNPETWLVYASALSTQHNDAEALKWIERALQARPAYAEAWASRALLRLRVKDQSGALADIEQALALKPHMAQLWQLAASLYHGANRRTEAVGVMRKALEANPANVDCMATLGEYLRQDGQAEAAIRLLEQAVATKPDHVAAWANLGTALQERGHLEHARSAYETALHLQPDQAEVAHNLGAMAIEAESWEVALEYFNKALALRPDQVQFLASKGQALLSLRRPPAEVEAVARQIFALHPEHQAGLMLLGALGRELGCFSDAIGFFRRVLARDPDSAQANAALALALKDADELVEAETCLRRAITLNPDKIDLVSGLLFTQSYRASHAPQYRLSEARRYGALVSSKVTQPHTPNPSVCRWPERLRVGVVSGDLRDHPVGYFLEGFLPHLDPSRVELIAYPTQHKASALTERLRSSFTAWVPLYGQSDAAAAQQIRSDGIHVLVDLSGHTGKNRLPVFAWRPAPVQASWLGYFATTGVEQMDFLLGDIYVTPPDEEAHFTERVWRLPESYLCFSPPAVDLEVAPLPALVAGYVTLGCFNNLAKMNDAVVALWARVLLALPTARLLLKTKQLADERQRQRTIERFAAQGIAAERLILEGPVPRTELLAAYHRVDIALDPFPYPGGTTSVEALWMGVPVLTKRGDSFLSHVGESIAHNAKLPHWIAQDEDDYVTKAVAFATDVAALARLRMDLREQVLASPLFDAPRFARHFEEALWGMWQHWLDTQEERLQ